MTVLASIGPATFWIAVLVLSCCWLISMTWRAGR